MDTRKSQGVQLRRLLAFLRPYWKSGSIILFLTLGMSALNAVEPLVQKAIFDALGGSAETLRSMSFEKFLLSAIGVLLGLMLLRELVQGVTNYLYWKLQLKTKYDLLDTAVRRIYNLSLSYHQNETVGATMTRLDRGINGFSAALFDISFNLLPSLLYLGCTIVFMFSLSWKLSIVALVFAPIPAVIGYFSARLSSRREKSLLNRWSKIYARFHETLNLIKTVKSFGLENRERERFLSGVSGANAEVQRGVGTDSLFGSAKNLVIGGGRIAILGLGAYLIAKGEITIGTLVAFLTYTGGLYMPMLGLAGFYEAFKKAKVYLDTIFEIIDTPEAVKDSPNGRRLERAEGRVEFQDVRFAYRPERPILNGVSFTAQPGSMVALVGHSGAGKTTVIDLLCRFYDPLAGSVRLDGHDLRDITQQSLRRHTAMVLQDTALFNDTIANNISIGCPEATHEDIVAAAKAANAHDFIERLPAKYDTIVGERGSNLSGGERQRVAIARAILKNPKILIFDEASSNLDSESERLIQASIDALSGDKTVFIIAHRLSTIRKADLILVLDGGKIAEQGTHEELVALGGIYKRLVNMQSLAVKDGKAAD